MGFKTIHDFPESTNPSGDWFVLVDDGTGCYKKVKLNNLPGGGSTPSTTSTTTTSGGGGGTTTSTTTTSLVPTTTSTTTSSIPNPEAQAYFSALASVGYDVNETEETAIIEFINALKEGGFYNKFVAIYPMLGDEYETMKFNLVNPQNTNGAYRLSPVGTISYTSTGATAAATSALNTHIIPTGTIPYNDNSMGIYIRTNFTGTATYDMGVSEGEDNSTFKLMTIATDDEGFSRSGNGPGLTTIVNATTDGRGFYVQNRTNDEEHRLYRNGVVVGSVNTYQTLPSFFPTISIYIGGIHGAFINGVEYTLSGRKEVSFAFVANQSLTVSPFGGELAILNTAVSNLITALGRTYTP